MSPGRHVSVLRRKRPTRSLVVHTKEWWKKVWLFRPSLAGGGCAVKTKGLRGRRGFRPRGHHGEGSCVSGVDGLLSGGDGTQGCQENDLLVSQGVVETHRVRNTRGCTQKNTRHCFLWLLSRRRRHYQSKSDKLSFPIGDQESDVQWT